MIDMTVTFEEIKQAQSRIASAISKTPIVTSGLLDDWLGHQILFKAECLQKTGSFKLRGATNFITKYLEENNRKPTKILANSSGNHAQAVAYAAASCNIPVEIYASANISPIKAAATRHYGAKLTLFKTRLEADRAIAQSAQRDPNAIWIPPFDHPDIIAGQGTTTLEAIQECGDVDAVCVPCGGGGLSSGALITVKSLQKSAAVIAAEPIQANDAAQSLRMGKIVKLAKTPVTIADGAATPSVGDFTFPFLKQLDQLVEVSESEIIYWTQWLQHLLKLHIEPTCAMTMQAAVTWLKQQRKQKRILVVLSGGNISTDTQQKIWQTDQLNKRPSL